MHTKLTKGGSASNLHPIFSTIQKDKNTAPSPSTIHQNLRLPNSQKLHLLPNTQIATTPSSLHSLLNKSIKPQTPKFPSSNPQHIPKTKPPTNSQNTPTPNKTQIPPTPKIP